MTTLLGAVKAPHADIHVPPTSSYVVRSRVVPALPVARTGVCGSVPSANRQDRSFDFFVTRPTAAGNPLHKIVAILVHRLRGNCSSGGSARCAPWRAKRRRVVPGRRRQLAIPTGFSAHSWACCAGDSTGRDQPVAKQMSSDTSPTTRHMHSKRVWATM